MTVRCGDTAFTYSFHILQQAVHDVILGRDIMHLCGMEVVGIPAVFPSDQDADGPRREAEHHLREPKRRLTTDDPSPFAALSKYPEALAMCEAAVARNVAARAASGGAATTLPNSQLRVRHAADTLPSYTPPYPIKHTDKSFVEGEIEEWLLWYQIEHVPHASHSPYNAPLLVAYTYASDGSIKKRRLCGDFRGLNKKLIIEEFGLPLIKDLLTSLSSQSCFTEIDLAPSGLPAIRRTPGRSDQVTVSA